MMPSYPTCRWLLIPVIAIHNAEEWLAVPGYGSISPTLQHHMFGSHAPPALPVLHAGWVIVTLVPALIVSLAASAGRSRVGDWLVCWVASLYLANSIVPHLLEFAISRTYAPGLVTAVLINLPFATLLLHRAKVEQFLSNRQVALAVAAGFAAQPVVLAAVHALAAIVTKWW